MRNMLSKLRCRWWFLVVVPVVLLVVALLTFKILQKNLPLDVNVLQRQTLDVGGNRRQYRLVIPKQLGHATPIPVLFAFHGAGETSEQMARYTRLDELAAEQGIFIVYPEGRNLSWPVTSVEENPAYLDSDLEFFDALLDHLTANYSIDTQRVYLLGMSQGGAFVMLLAAKRSEKIAAFASHSAWIPKQLERLGIHAQRKLPGMFLTGSEDTVVPPRFGREARDCFKGEGHPTELHVLPGVGHFWTPQTNINQKIWKFLSAHIRR